MISNFKITIQDVHAKNAIVVDSCYGNNRITYNYLLAEGVVNEAYGIQNKSSMNAQCIKNYISNVYYGMGTRLGTLSSEYNDDTGTQPKYGLRAVLGGIIGKRGTQPTGSIANELVEYGGMIG